MDFYDNIVFDCKKLHGGKTMKKFLVIGIALAGFAISKAARTQRGKLLLAEAKHRATLRIKPEGCNHEGDHTHDEQQAAH
jgi:hypothetical protein